MEINTEILVPRHDETIIFSYDYDIDYDQARKIFDEVKKQYPGYKVIAIPAFSTLRSCSLEVIENIINELLKIADSMREDYLPF